MPRAVVLPSLARAAAPPAIDDESPRYGTRDPAAEASASGDAYNERLVKYIPGEALAFFLAFSSAESTSDGLMILLLAAGTVGAVLWALNRNGRLDTQLRQPPVLLTLYTAAAFVAWAFGTSANAQELIGWPQQTCAVIMGSVALLLPGIDDTIMRRRQERRLANSPPPGDAVS